MLFRFSVISINMRGIVRLQSDPCSIRIPCEVSCRAIFCRSLGTCDSKGNTKKNAYVFQRIPGHRTRWNVVQTRCNKRQALTAPLVVTKELESSTLCAHSIPEVLNERQRRMTIAHATEAVQNLFLPRGYPNSVSKHFAAYCKWQFASNALGTVTGVLSMQALLFAVGVGAGSVPLAATINWILKDGMGQLGGIVYGAYFADRFDVDPKRHRYLSTLALQASTLLEIVTPLVPQLFLPLASLSNVGKNISWLAGSGHARKCIYLYPSIEITWGISLQK
eukprot:m.1230351 g.1230351  ORF g.1230351 m.1230351 type:complete len:278 (-) comp24652_c1_seq51:4111-4944(-)